MPASRGIGHVSAGARAPLLVLVALVLGAAGTGCRSTPSARGLLEESRGLHLETSVEAEGGPGASSAPSRLPPLAQEAGKSGTQEQEASSDSGAGVIPRVPEGGEGKSGVSGGDAGVSFDDPSFLDRIPWDELGEDFDYTDPSEFRIEMRGQYLRRPDGLVTKFYPVQNALGTMLGTEIPKHVRPEDPTKPAVTVVKDFDIWRTMDAAGKRTETKVGDLLVITDTEETILDVDRFLETLLGAAPQFEIEVRVVEIIHQRGTEVGATTSVLGANEGGTAFRELLADLNAPNALSDDNGALQTGSPAGIFDLGAVQDEVAVNTLLRVLQTREDTDVLSAPRIVVRNGVPAEVVTGEEFPIQNIQNLTGTGFTITTTFKQTGVNLRVIPQLLGADTVQMDVSPQVSAITKTLSTSLSTGVEVQQPVIATRSAHTLVNVKDGHTLILGGLLRTREAEIENKVPILGDIPVLGWLFKSFDRDREVSELIFFITPRILSARAQSARDLILPSPGGSYSPGGS